MLQKPLISVIIPIYNVEKYLPECMSSVLEQTYTNLEIILIDDGSTDKCPQLCGKYAAGDSRVKVIHKQNSGQAQSRNMGLDIAAGEYITFVDSDDWIAPDMIEFLYNSLTADNTDISCCGHYRSFADTNHLPEKSKPPWHHRVLTNVEVATLAHATSFALAPWGKLYKKHIFDNIRFPVGKIYEDAWVIIDIFMAADKVSLDGTPKYYYRKRKGSTVRKNSNATIALLKAEMLEERLCRIESSYPGLIPVGRAAMYRQYIAVISAVLAESGYDKSSGNYKALSQIISKIKRNAVRLQTNKHLTIEERLNLLAVAISIRLHKPYMRFQALVHPGRTRRLKRKRQARQNERVLFE